MDQFQWIVGTSRYRIYCICNVFEQGVKVFCNWSCLTLYGKCVSASSLQQYEHFKKCFLVPTCPTECQLSVITSTYWEVKKNNNTPLLPVIVQVTPPGLEGWEWLKLTRRHVKCYSSKSSTSLRLRTSRSTGGTGTGGDSTPLRP